MTDSMPLIDSMDLLHASALPSSEDNLFSSQDDWWNNACLNWCHDNWGLYASGYKKAADLLVQGVEERNSCQDSLVYPVLFLYRQYLELEIKGLIRQARRLQDVAGDFPKSHRINELWRDCHKLLSEISPGDSTAELKQITRLINEFSDVDKESMAFRYPEGKNGNPSLPGVHHINLRNVREVIGKISIILMGANLQIGEYMSIKNDMEREFRHEW